jgi:chemotaxis protein CheX
MTTVNVETINPFISAAKTVLSEFCKIDVQMGKPYLAKSEYEGNALITIIGVTGQLRGQVIINMDIETACKIASNMMMGMPVNELNDMAKSAVSELTNMILGNAATIFSTNGITIDITPPSVCLGNNLSISVSDAKNICVPLIFEEKYAVNINVALKER